MFPIWLLLEFLLFIKLVSVYGFLKIFTFYTLPSFLGFVILTYYPKALIGSLQNTMQMQEKPSSKMLHSLFIIVSGLFFIIPAFTTRIIALFMFLPIFRHILVAVLMWKWYKLAGKFFGKLQKFNTNSNAKGFSFYTGFYSNSGANERSASFNGFKQLEDTPEQQSESIEREVIDVTPKRLDD
jgi:UPF0716 family protein affecting phage T7 exclusion